MASGKTVVVERKPSPSDANVRGYRPELDAARFLAFLSVFVHHFLMLAPRYLKDIPPGLSQSDLRLRLALGETGAMGLSLFFALSAYLITELLLRERSEDSTISVRKFYIRRILRIWPLYFFGIALAIALAFVMREQSQAIAFVWYLLFAGNIYCGIFGWPANPMTSLWSISIEEQFYLLWPWAMRWLSKRGLFYCALIFIAAANVTLYLLGNRHVDTEVAVWTNTLVQFQMFAVGILLALKGRIKTHNPAIGAVLILAGPIIWFTACSAFHPKQPGLAGTASSGVALILGYALVALGCAAVLQGFCMVGPEYMPGWAVHLGKISYGLYVFHVLAIDFGHALFKPVKGPLYWAGSVSVAFLLTTCAATISYALLETPFLRLKRRFEILHTRPI